MLSPTCPPTDPRPAAPGPRPRRAGRALPAVVAVLALLGAACNRGDSGSTDQAGQQAPTTTALPGVVEKNLGDEAAAKDGGKLVIGLEAETEGGFNPVSGRFAGSGHYIASAIYDPLVTLDEKGQPVPYLAEKIDHNKDFTSWTIDLRSGVTFHDGTPLDAAAVKATLDGHKASIVTSKAVKDIDTISVSGPLQVTVTMKQPWSMFPYILSSQVGYVVAPSMLADPNSGAHPVGTGPYVFKDWTPNVSFKATRNPSYWQKGKPHLSELEFRPMPDAAKRSDALVNKELDMMLTLTPRDIVRLRTEPDLKMLEVSTGEKVCIALNAGKEPFDNLDARLAVAYATDTDRFLRETGRDIAPKGNGPLAPGRLGYRDKTNAPTFDLAKAKEHVAAYTAATGKPLTFTYQGADNTDDLAGQQLLKEMWEAAGMQVTVKATPQSAQIINAVLGSYDAVDWRNFGSTDPDGDYVWFHSSSSAPAGQLSLDVPRIVDPELDKLLDAGRATLDASQRDGLYAQATERINADGGYVWLERADWAIVAVPGVNGFRAARNGSLSTLGAKTWLADLWLDR